MLATKGKQCQFRGQACRKLRKCSLDLDSLVREQMKEYRQSREEAEKVEKHNWSKLSKDCVWRLQVEV